MQTVLVWAPCLFLVVLIPLDIYYARISKYSNIPWGYLNVTRLFLSLALIIISLVDLIMAATWSTDELYNVHIVTPIIKIVTFVSKMTHVLEEKPPILHLHIFQVTVILLSFLHKKRGIVSSGLVFLFWFALTILAIPQFRDEIRQFERRPANTIGTEKIAWDDYQFISNMIYFPLLVVQLLVNCLADKEPINSEYEYIPKVKPSPESSASFLRKILFQWFDPMTWRGYRKPLEVEDMWDVNPEDNSSEMVPVFDKYWRENVAKNHRVKTKNTEKKEEGPTATKVNQFIIGSMNVI